jgi:hypothetical protein
MRGNILEDLPACREAGRGSRDGDYQKTAVQSNCGFLFD